MKRSPNPSRDRTERSRHCRAYRGEVVDIEFEAFFTGEKGDSIFQTMQTQSQQILTKK